MPNETLIAKLNYIKDQKDEFLIPSNIRDGVTVLNVTGTLEEGAMTQVEYSEALVTTRDILGSLPYVELEYIQSTGTQYIDTGVPANGDVKIDIDFLTSGSTAYHSILGARSSEKLMYFLNADSNGGLDYTRKEIGYKSSLDQPTLSFTTHEVRTNILWDKTSITISNTNGSYNKVFSGNFESGLNIFLFGFNDNGTVDRIGNTKIYYCKIYWNNLIVRDFIPVKRTSDNEICLYDTLTNQFFTNAGTGTFTAGPEKV